MLVNIRQEMSFLGCLLMTPRLVDNAVTAGINKETFTLPFYQEMWEWIEKNYQDGMSVTDEDALNHFTNNSNDVIDCLNECITSATFDNAVKSLRAMEAGRVLRQSMMDTLENMENCVGAPDIQDTSAKLVEMDSRISSVVHNDRIQTLQDMMDQANGKYAHPASRLRLFPEHWEANAAFSFHAGEIMSLNASSGTGKTAMGVQMATELAKQGKRILYVCTESTDLEIFERLTASYTEIPHYWAMDDARDESRRLFVGKMGEYADAFSQYITVLGLHKRVPNAYDIIRKIKTIEYQQGHIDCVFVDFIQDISFPDAWSRDTKREKIEKSVNLIHDAVLANGNACVFLGQLNRNDMDDGDRPDLKHIKECSLIAEKAHIVCFLYRKPRRNQAVRKGQQVFPTSDGDKRQQIAPDDDFTQFYSRKVRNTTPFDLELGWARTHYISRCVDTQPPVQEPQRNFGTYSY